MCNCVTIVGLLTRCSIPSVCLLHDCLIVAGHDTQEAEAWQHSTYCVTSQHLCTCQPDQPIVSRHDTGHYVATFIGWWHGIYVWYTDEMLTTDPNMLDSSLSLSGPELRICLQVTLSAPGPHTYGIYLAPAAGLMCFSYQASHKQHFPPASSHPKYTVTTLVVAVF